MYKNIFEKSADGMLIIENDCFVDCNDAVVKMLKYEDKEKILNTHPSELSPELQPDGRSSFKKAEENIRLVREKGHHIFEWVHLRANGEEFWVEVVLTDISEDEIVRLLVVWREIGEKKRLENKEAEYKRGLELETTKLFNQYKLVHNIIDTVPVRIFWKDKKGVYLGANKLFIQDAKLKSANDIVGKSDFELPWAKTEAQLYRDDDLAVMESGKPRINFEETQTYDNEGTIVLLTSKVPLEDIDGNMSGILGAYTDITYLRNIEEELENQKNILSYQAYHDELTNLPNRTLFNDRLEHALAEAKRNKTKVALLFIDLDHFKEINDSLGHIVGDEILKIIAKRFRNTVRKQDTIARFGGDEFAMLVEDLNEEQDVSNVAQKLLDVLSKPITIKEYELYVSSSIGISIYPDDGEITSDVLKYADSAMYKAKNEGRNNFQYYSSEMTEISLERVIMGASLREALKKQEIVVYFQPHYNGKTNKSIGMEARARWEHPTLGLILPAKFIPLAETTGLIVELDRYVMKIAMEQVVKWYKEGLSPGILAMNLAQKQLRQKDFIETLQIMIKETKCNANWLELEVTEDQVMSNPEEVVKSLQQVSDSGISVAVDDFGTGYSSLSYLKKLPINRLKIDQLFVKDLPDNEEDAVITKTIIALAKSLNLKVIAEGVETKEQKDFLIENGCENIQGYYYAKPMEADKMHALLQEELSAK